MVYKFITHIAILFVQQLNNIFCMCFAENSILLMKCSFFCATLNLADILDRSNAKSEIRGNNTRFKT